MNKAMVLLIVSLLAIGGVLAEGQQDTGIKDVNAGFLNEDSGNGGDGNPDNDVNGSGENTDLETQNKGEDSNIQARVQTNNPEVGEMAQQQAKNENGYRTFVSNKGEQVLVRTENGAAINSNGVEAKTKLHLRLENDSEGNQSRIHVNLSNGRNAEVKVMPSTASETALQRLGLKVCEPGNCTIELKEVGKGDEAEPAYEIEATTEGKFLGLFKTRAKVKTQVSAETGEVLRVKKPFLTSVKESDDSEETEE